MPKALITAIAFSLIYLLQLLAVGIGAFKEGGGRGLSCCFAAALLVLWGGFLFIRTRTFRYRTVAFVAFALSLTLWVNPARQIEVATEEHENRETTATLRSIQVSNVTDDPFLNSQGKPLGIRMRYSVRFPRDGLYPAAPVLTSTDGRQSMRIIHAEITPRPQATQSDSLNTGTYAKYTGNVTYSFVVDLVPGFIIVSPDKTKSCLSFANVDQKNAVMTSDGTTLFHVHIDGTDYGGYLGGAEEVTKNAYNIKEFYQNALENGARVTCEFDSRGEIR